MRDELDQQLCQHYPELFAKRHADPLLESCMGRGFCCGDGWFPLIDALCAEITAMVAEGKSPAVEVSQVKEKFGSLRFRIRGGNEAVRHLIRNAEDRSDSICGDCGRPKLARQIPCSDLCLDCQRAATTPK